MIASYPTGSSWAEAFRLGALLVALTAITWAQPPSLEQLQPKIDEAINRGVDGLLRAQSKDGTWDAHAYSFPVGGTALCTYALLKAGLTPDHPGVARALRFLETNLSEKTYGAACQIMALEATHDPKYKPQIKKLLQRLLKWQKEGWGYPDSMVDMSNTQYAALGLRAAQAAGFNVPKRAVFALIDEAIRHQEPAVEVKLPKKPGDEYERQAPAAGFRYRADEEHQATGAMTTAGLGILLICEGLVDGKLPAAWKRKIDTAKERGENWLAANWSIEQDPPNRKRDDLYYLYGLERVGDLQRRETLAGHLWYREGADFIVRLQRDDGTWHNNSVDTSFGVLFLKRATWSGSVSGGGMGRRQRVYLAASDSADVRLRGAGNPDLTLWIDGFHERVHQRFKNPDDDTPVIYVESVEYLLDGQRLHLAPADSKIPWKGEPFGHRYTFTRCGSFSLAAKVTVRNPSPKPGESETVTLDSPLMIVEVRDLPTPGANELMDRLVDNRLLGQTFTMLRASGSEHGLSAPGNIPFIADQRLTTAWKTKPDDQEPWIEFKLKEKLHVREFTIWPLFEKHADGRPVFDVLREVHVYLNGADRPIVLNVSGDGSEPLQCKNRLGVPIREMKIVIKKRDPSPHQTGRCGISELSFN